MYKRDDVNCVLFYRRYFWNQRSVEIWLNRFQTKKKERIEKTHKNTKLIYIMWAKCVIRFTPLEIDHFKSALDYTWIVYKSQNNAIAQRWIDPRTIMQKFEGSRVSPTFSFSIFHLSNFHNGSMISIWWWWCVRELKRFFLIELTFFHFHLILHECVCNSLRIVLLQ